MTVPFTVIVSKTSSEGVGDGDGDGTALSTRLPSTLSVSKNIEETSKKPTPLSPASS
jgi:hypothetical protein